MKMLDMCHKKTTLNVKQMLKYKLMANIKR